MPFAFYYIPYLRTVEERATQYFLKTVLEIMSPSTINSEDSPPPIELVRPSRLDFESISHSYQPKHDDMAADGDCISIKTIY